MALFARNRPEEKTNHAECFAAHCLSKLPDNWIVVWGAMYKKSHEIDFLLCSPEGIFFVVEVKGGNIFHYAPTGKWTSETRQNPWWQLLAEHKGVIGRLKKVAGADRAVPYVEKLLFLPGINDKSKLENADGFLPGDIPSENVMDADECNYAAMFFQNLCEKLKARFSEKPDIPAVDSKAARELFLKTFAPGATPTAMRAHTRHADAVLLKFLRAEFRLLDALADNRQLVVRGGAGTGKTFFAVEQARRLAARGNKVLMLSYNLAFAKSLRELVESLAQTQPSYKNIDVLYHEQLLERLAAEAGLPFRDNDSFGEAAAERGEYWNRALPLAIYRALDQNKFAPRYDALVVDEAQDHDTYIPQIASEYPGNTGWWRFYHALVRQGANAPAALFFDTTQRPAFRSREGFSEESLLRIFPSATRVRLNATYRYSLEISQWLRDILQLADESARPAFALPDREISLPGAEVITHQPPPDAPRDDTRKRIEKIISDWISSGQCKPGEILLLGTPRDKSKTVLGSADTLAGLPLCDYAETFKDAPTASAPRNNNALRYLNIDRAKGMDELAVIVIDALDPKKTNSAETRNAAVRNLFTGASRARQLLAVIWK